MESTFTGLEIGKRSLFAHQRALTTIGHNISNAGAEGYSRQRVNLQATEPLYAPQLNRAETPGQIGQGVDVANIERVKDMLLEGRIVQNSSGEAYWQERDKYVKQLSEVYNEPTELSIRNLTDKFWDGWQELSMYPEQMAARQQVLEKGKGLVDGIKNRYEQLDQIRSVLNEEVRTKVQDVNGLTHRIAQLNEVILKSQAEGDNPNDLMDQRDLLVNKLSSLINISIDTRDPDEFSVYTDGRMIVQGKLSTQFETKSNTENEGLLGVYWKGSTEEAHFQSGKLASYIDMRDVDLRKQIQNLDTLAVNIVNMTNEIHRQGFGANGKTGVDFFNQFPFVENANGNYDRNGDGKLDTSYVYRVSGTNPLSPDSPVGLKGTMKLNGPKGEVSIDYFPADTVRDIIIRINQSGAEVSARLDNNGKLSLKAEGSASKSNPDFVLRGIEDSGQFLVGYSGLLKQSGAAGAYNFNQVDAVNSLAGGTSFGVAPLTHPSAWIGVNVQVQKDPLALAASLGTQTKPGDIGDGSAALAIAGLRNTNVKLGKSGSFDDYFADTVNEVGLKGSEAKLAMNTYEKILKDLRDQKDSYSGVNLDEEMANMIKYQHGYNAAARFVSEVDKMLDVIINRMGV